MYSDKLFEFSNVYFSSPQNFDGIMVYQFGETCIEAGGRIDEHRQQCHEISLILSGESLFYTEGVNIKCVPGDIHIISKGLKHEIAAMPGSKLRYIHFAFDFSDKAALPFKDVFEGCRNVVVKDRGNIRKLMTMLVNEYYNNYEYTDTAKESLVKLILIEVKRTMRMELAQYLPSSEPESRKTVYDVIRYIENNLSYGLSVGKVAEEFSYNSNYLSHMFKKRTGMSIQEYIVTAKMKKAEELLKDGKSSINEVVKLCGYESLQSFSRTFKKYSGVSPGEYADRFIGK